MGVKSADESCSSDDDVGLQVLGSAGSYDYTAKEKLAWLNVFNAELSPKRY